LKHFSPGKGKAFRGRVLLGSLLLVSVDERIPVAVDDCWGLVAVVVRLENGLPWDDVVLLAHLKRHDGVVGVCRNREDVFEKLSNALLTNYQFHQSKYIGPNGIRMKCKINLIAFLPLCIQ